MQETWKDIPGYDGYYQASDLGQIRNKHGKIFKSCDARGYRIVTLNGVSKRVHGLILLTFVGPRPEGLQCRHMNNDPSDNRLSNICYGTRAENDADKVKAKAEADAIDVFHIKYLRNLGFSWKQISKLVGMNVTTIRYRMSLGCFS